MNTGFEPSAAVAVDCTVITVTYNSADRIAGLLDTLPAAAEGLRVRVIVVDNGSTDDLPAVLAKYPDVVFHPTRQNLGYSGGINAGRELLGETDAVLILNPDLELAPGSVRKLLAALHEDGVGAAVPRFDDEHGEPYPSLRREPSIGRALGDALLGKKWPNRPAGLSEMVWAKEPYERPGDVDWATGAVLAIAWAADEQLGPWDDERFFLYSEETDYARRLRQAGWTIRYVPDAVVTHEGGASGASHGLVALNTVNRVRYFAKYHGRLATAVFRAVVALNEALRIHRPANRYALRVLLSRKRWATLPGGDRPQQKGLR
ncbi:MAG: glycosyltransferase family 2 protein [Catenulispora sp.]|nr:glycosyltransferase family 2 protein [Catenulispora sp.]